MQTTTDEFLHALFSASDKHKSRALKILKGECPEVHVATQVAGRAQVEPYVTLREAARLLGVSACSLWRWGVRGHELGGRPKYRVSEVVEYLESDEFIKKAEELRLKRKAKN
jgi:hypothetical protein